MAKVYSYIRFSSKIQERGDSMRRQTEGTDAWVLRNNHVLDTSLYLADKGVSAFRGKNRHKGALKRFLDAIKEGRVKLGEILLVENLDRLSREGVSEAFTLFNEILCAGIHIAVLTPTERVYTKKSINNNLGELLEPLMAFHLAGLESQKKSDRVGSIRAKQRRDAQATGKPMSRRCPSWIQWDESKRTFVVKPDGAMAIRHIFQRTVDGVGQRQMLDELKMFKPLGTSGAWNGSYIQKILSDRAVLGELQPKRFDEDGSRVPDGKLILDYYPQVVDDGLFYRAQQAKLSRVKQKGPNTGFINLFTGIVFNARDSHPMHIQTTRTKRLNGDWYVQRRFLSYGHWRKKDGSCPYSVEYNLFEAALLQVFLGLKPSDIMPETGKRGDTFIHEKANELAGVEGRLGDLQRQLEDPDTKLSTVLAAVAKLETKQKELKKEIEHLKREFASHEDDPLQQAKSLIEILNAKDEVIRKDVRTKLRVVIPSIVEKILLIPIKQQKRKVFCWVQVNFRNGTFRQFLMRHKDVVGHTDQEKSVPVDFGNPEHVKKLVANTERL